MHVCRFGCITQIRSILNSDYGPFEKLNTWVFKCIILFLSIFTDCQHELWCLHPGNYKQQTTYIWIHFKCSPWNWWGEKNPKLLTERDHLETLDDRSRGPKGFWGDSWKEERRRGKKRCREKQQRSYIYETMSWVPLCRQDDNYRAQAKKPWLGKKVEIFRLLGCRPWALKITTMLSSNPTV